MTSGVAVTHGRVRRSSATTQIAWAAGLFEGEGSIDLSAPGTHVKLQLGSTDRDVVQKFMEVVSCGSIRPRGPSPRGKKPMHVWSVGFHTEVTRILGAFLPWLGERRTARALEALGRTTQARKYKRHTEAYLVKKQIQRGGV